MKNKSSSFTLIEMSISILVIGILTTGIMVGRTIIDKSKIQSISTDLIQIKKNYQLFKSTYGVVPGKLTYQQCISEGAFNESGICGTSQVSKDTLATNDNFATITSLSSVTNPSVLASPGIKGDSLISTWTESISASLYMSLAKMSDVVYKTPSYNSNGFTVPGYKNILQKLKGSNNISLGFFGISSSTTAVPSDYFVGGIKNFYNFLDKNFIVSISSTSSRSVFSPNTVKALDMKIDNGSPYSGDLIVANGASSITSTAPSTSCTSGSAFSSATYVNSDTTLCSIAFLVD